jgi:hypothetical protein
MNKRRLGLYLAILACGSFLALPGFSFALYIPFGFCFFVSLYCWRIGEIQQSRFNLYCAMALFALLLWADPETFALQKHFIISLLFVSAALRLLQVESANDSAKVNFGFAQDLRKAIPEKARLFVDLDIESEVELDRIQKGAVIRVDANEPIPLDGEVESGSSLLDESPIGGSPEPRPVGPGHLVRAGSLNRNSQLLIRVEAPHHRSFASLAALELEEKTAGKNLVWEAIFSLILLLSVLKSNPLLFAMSLALEPGPWILRHRKAQLLKRRERVARGWLRSKFPSDLPNTLVLPLEKELSLPLPKLSDQICSSLSAERMLVLATGVARFRAEPWALAILEEARNKRVPFPWVERMESGELSIDGKSIELRERDFSEGKWTIEVWEDQKSVGTLIVSPRVRNESIAEANRLLDQGMSLVFFHSNREEYSAFWKSLLPKAQFLRETRSGVVAEAVEKMRAQGLNVWRSSHRSEWENQDVGQFYGRQWTVRSSLLPEFRGLLDESNQEERDKKKHGPYLFLVPVTGLALAYFSLPQGLVYSALCLVFVWIAPSVIVRMIR